MAEIPENILFLNLPAHRHTTFSELPERAERKGVMYFVTDDDDKPVGIALSGKDLQVQFYSIMQVLNAGDIPFDGQLMGSDVNTVKEAIDFLFQEAQLSAEMETLITNITKILDDVLGVGTAESLDDVLGV